jgi:transcriptional regulator with XRE-family HTH domain
LGHVTRISSKFVGQIERGESNPSIATMLLIADALRCGLHDLIPSDSIQPAVSIRADDVRRVQDALKTLNAVLKTRKIIQHGKWT